MQREDAIKVIRDLTRRPFIIGDKYIITDSGYKITKSDMVVPIEEDEYE